MKAERQRLILSIIAHTPIETQDELVAALAARGTQATQATVSRDIKELRLVKVTDAQGRYRYALPDTPASSAAVLDARQRVQRAVRDYAVSLDHSGNLLVMKTQPGTAQAVAAAIDALGLDGIVGTVAGDDAILIITQVAPNRPPPPGPPADVYAFFQTLLQA